MMVSWKPLMSRKKEEKITKENVNKIVGFKQYHYYLNIYLSYKLNRR